MRTYLHRPVTCVDHRYCGSFSACVNFNIAFCNDVFAWNHKKKNCRPYPLKGGRAGVSILLVHSIYVGIVFGVSKPL